MKRQTAARVQKWFFSMLIMSGLVYSMVVLTAIPAAAADCTPSECNDFYNQANAACFDHAGIYDFYCGPGGFGQNGFFYICNDQVTEGAGPC